MIPSSDRISDFAIFEDIYNLNIDFNGDNQEFAVITWNSKNGYTDDKSEAFTYGFTLQKDKNIWKVNFMPMQ